RRRREGWLMSMKRGIENGMSNRDHRLTVGEILGRKKQRWVTWATTMEITGRQWGKIRKGESENGMRENVEERKKKKEREKCYLARLPNNNGNRRPVEGEIRHGEGARARGEKLLFSPYTL
ncbi:hypothetical protein ACLOJK_034380, partial [Asimina triloba]